MKLLKYILSIPKTLWFNFAVFSIKTAIKLPVLIAYNVKISNVHKNCIVINSEIKRFMIKININEGSEGVNSSYLNNGYFFVGDKGRIVFNGKANFCSGVSIRLDDGEMVFGNDFSCNRNCFFACSEKIVFGNNVLLGWSVNVRDSDGHLVYDLNEKKSEKKTVESVNIGNHVWVAAKVDILKGVEIPNDCVVGYNSCVTKKFTDSNCIIAGYPAIVVKENINWEK